jgi:uncharacterized protein (DUF4213/DUF364 family)
LIVSVKSELLDLAETAVDICGIEAVRDVYLPDPEPAPDKEAEFGIVTLDDGSAALYFAWLGEGQEDMDTRYAPEHFRGMPVRELLAYYRSDDPAKCSLGLATINALTSSLFRRAGYVRPQAGNSLGGMQFENGDRVGMVGYFPSLVEKLRERRIPLTVLEKKSEYVEEGELFRVTLDPAGLGDCNKVVSTASTLLNNSIDEILAAASGAEELAIIGPTAGFFPDPLFKRGVTAIGGSEVIDAALALQRLKADERVGDAGRKFVIMARDYPGIESILRDCGKRRRIV